MAGVAAHTLLVTAHRAPSIVSSTASASPLRVAAAPRARANDTLGPYTHMRDATWITTIIVQSGT